MVFNYKWSDKEHGNFAIKKRNSKGIRIERKRNQQTKDSHYFIFVNENDTDSMINAYQGLNKILETIHFDYRERGTNKKSGTPFLKKEHIENVLNNIEQYENETITIETPFSKTIQKEKMKLENKNFNEWKKLVNDLYKDDNESWEAIMTSLKDNIEKDNEFKEEQLKAEQKIKQLYKEIKQVRDNLLKYEKTIQTKKEKNENDVYVILKKKLKDLPISSNTEKLNFTNLLNISLYDLAKTYKQRKAHSKRVRERREKENIKKGIPKRKRGRPRKTEK